MYFKAKLGQNGLITKYCMDGHLENKQSYNCLMFHQCIKETQKLQITLNLIPINIPYCYFFYLKKPRRCLMLPTDFNLFKKQFEISDF